MCVQDLACFWDSVMWDQDSDYFWDSVLWVLKNQLIFGQCYVRSRFRLFLRQCTVSFKNQLILGQCNVRSRFRLLLGQCNVNSRFKFFGIVWHIELAGGKDALCPLRTRPKPYQSFFSFFLKRTAGHVYLEYLVVIRGKTFTIGKII